MRLGPIPRGRERLPGHFLFLDLTICFLSLLPTLFVIEVRLTLEETAAVRIDTCEFVCILVGKASFYK